MVAYFRRVAAFSDIQQHGEISMIHFIFIFIWFLPCLFWCYPLFQCVYKSSTIFLYFCLPVLLNILSSCPVYPYFLLEAQLDVRSEYKCLVKRFREIPTHEIIFSKVWDLSFSSIYFSSDFTRDSITKFTE